jgi:hypothetical protein
MPRLFLIVLLFSTLLGACKKQEDILLPPDNLLVSGWKADIFGFPREEASYEYDDLNRVKKVTYVNFVSNTSYEVEVSYTAEACQFKFVYNNGYSVRYEFLIDENNRVYQMRHFFNDELSGQAILVRDDQGNPLSIDGAFADIPYESELNYTESGLASFRQLAFGGAWREEYIFEYDRRQIATPGVFNMNIFWELSLGHEVISPLPLEMTGYTFFPTQKYLPKKIVVSEVREGFSDRNYEWFFTYERAADGRLVELRRKSSDSDPQENRVVFSYINKK